MDELIEISSMTRITADALSNIRQYMKDSEGSYADNTMRAVRADTGVFFRWCADHGVQGLPANPRHVAYFVDDSHSKRPSTIHRCLSSIAKVHRAAGLIDPTKEECVKLAVKRMEREVGTARKQAKPIRRAMLDQMIAACDKTTPIGIRDAAILAVAYDTMCRESEIVAMRVRDFSFASDGKAVVFIPRSKGDQRGEGRHKYLHNDTVDFLREYLRLLPRDHQGQAFRAMDHYQLAGPLQAPEIARIFRKVATRAGFDPEGISGHSIRVGVTQDCNAAGIATGKTANAGGWSSEKYVHMYSRELDTRDSATAELAKVQGR